MDAATFASVCNYVDFTEESSAALRAFHPVIRPHIAATIDDFYATIEAHPDARQVITGGRPQIERLKRTLRSWMDTLFMGPHDHAYVQQRARIGRVHVRIGLPQEFMFTAMNRIRTHAIRVAQDEYANDVHQREPLVRAINQILDIELAVMLDTYREDYVAKMRAAERLATIGQLAASIGHELRNPLGIVESSLFLARRRLSKLEVSDENLDKHLDKISRQVVQCGRIITDLLELARNRSPRARDVLASDLAEYALESLSLPPDVRVVREIPGDVSLWADADQLRQVLGNLVSNAAAACDGKGTITLSAGRDEAGAWIRVADDGPGVRSEIRGRIFDALFTTKAKGTGLGLALCRRILEAHGGSVQLEDTDTGASFRL